MAHRPRKNPLDFGGNPCHVMLVIELPLRLMLHVFPGRTVLQLMSSQLFVLAMFSSDLRVCQALCGSVAEWLGPRSIRCEFECWPLRCRVQPSASC